MTAHSHSHADMLPKGTLITAGALVLFALTATATVRLAHIPAAASPVAMRDAGHMVPVEQRNLRFTDRADGAVVIEDVDQRATAAVIEPGQKTGFIRGVMRGLARERRSRGIGNGPAFNLSLWRDGELSFPKMKAYLARLLDEQVMDMPLPPSAQDHTPQFGA